MWNQPGSERTDVITIVPLDVLLPLHDTLSWTFSLPLLTGLCMDIERWEPTCSSNFSSINRGTFFLQS